MTIDEIRAMLAKITPGKWSSREGLDNLHKVWTTPPPMRAIRYVSIVYDEHDAAFIAKAPEIVAWLLSEIEDSKIKHVRENMKLRDSNGSYKRISNQLREENEKLRAEVARLEEAQADDLLSGRYR